MTFLENSMLSVSHPVVLFEMDINVINLQWINCGAGIWKCSFLNSYPEVDASLLDGFTPQSFRDIGSALCDGVQLTKVESINLLTTVYMSFYFDIVNKIIYVTLLNYESPTLHLVTIGEIYGMSDISFSPIGSAINYEGRMDEFPTIGYQRDPTYFGKFSFPAVTFSFKNNDGVFDMLAENNSIYGNSIRVLYGYADLNITDYLCIYSGLITVIAISEDTVSVTSADARNRYIKGVNYSCDAKNALAVIRELLSIHYRIPIDLFDAYFIEAETTAPIITITMRSTERKPVITIIEEICKSLFGMFFITPLGYFSFRNIDMDAYAVDTIKALDILEKITVTYDPQEVLSSARVSFNKNVVDDTTAYKDWVEDTSREEAIFLKYKTYSQKDFDTVLNSQIAAQALLDLIMDYNEDVHGTSRIVCPMSYYAVTPIDTINVELNRENSNMLGTKKCEVLGKNYLLGKNMIEFYVRIV